ncbi:MAG: PEP/pyruvate-binding domain-containing protein [Desulfobulbus sp.]|jgi:pyruvate,water dikinase
MSTIIENVKNMVNYFRKKDNLDEGDSNEITALFRFKYALFKDLLVANSSLLTILSDIDEKLSGEHLFGISYINNQVNKSLTHAFQLVKSLNVMSSGKYRELYTSLDKINNQIKELLDTQKVTTSHSTVMLYEDISLEDSDWVGGKNANLGEIKNFLNIPVPEGFAITTTGFHDFFEYNDLKESIIRQKNLIYVNEVDMLNDLSAETQELIRSKPLPAELERDILSAVRQLWGDKEDLLVALRSSAVGEDGDISYAGQFLTLLGLSRDEICESYKSIIASLYSARSISYRSSKGIIDEDMAMAVACLKMIDSQASGVLYTRHPYNIVNEHILINAVWGLGPYAVDGVVTPDSYTVTKEKTPQILEKHISTKPVQLKLEKSGGVKERPVPEDLQQQPCLTDEQITLLAGYGAALEEHYKCPQDIEWAMDADDKLYILQSRPLKIRSPKDYELIEATAIDGYDLLLENCEIACQGVGTGPVVHIQSQSELGSFPEGGVLVARRSSPEYVMVMRQCTALVVGSGSVSGHMAALSREFGVPTIISDPLVDVIESLPAGVEVTVDAYTGRVYRGIVSELLTAAQQRDTAHMKGTPIYDLLQDISRLINPLNLVNPESPEFSPEYCTTLHDLARFCHEYSYKEMFNISDLASKTYRWSHKLNAPLPMDIHLIDLGNGLREDRQRRNVVEIDDITSVPFLALLQGMLNKDVHGLEPRPVNFSGLFSVIREQAFSFEGSQERFGDRSYAIIADKYLNFSSRVGYHYSIVDVYCGETVSKNYISFSFKGGAADDVRKNRRVRAISLILTNEGFNVNVKGDQVSARIQKYPNSFIELKMDMLGKLLIFTRQLDMLMTSESTIEWVAENFLQGNYKLSSPPP